MIIDFSELTIPFHRFAPGAILISPNDERYMKMLDIDFEYFWRHSFDPACETYSTETQMKAMVGDGEGWKVLS